MWMQRTDGPVGPDGRDPTEQLSDDVLMAIFQQLPMFQQFRAGMVSTRWRRLVTTLERMWPVLDVQMYKYATGLRKPQQFASMPKTITEFTTPPVSIRALVTTASGKLYAGNSEGSVQAWRVATGEMTFDRQGGLEIGLPEGYVCSLEVSSDDQRVFFNTQAGGFYECSAATGVVLRQLWGKRGTAWHRGFMCMTMSPCATCVYAGGTHHLWMKEDKKEDEPEVEHSIEVHGDYIISMVLSRDGEVLYTGTDNGRLKAYSAVGSYDYLWDGDVRVNCYLPNAGIGQIKGMALTADGKRLYVGGRVMYRHQKARETEPRAGTVQMWTTALTDGHMVREFASTADTGEVNALVMSGDEQRLYTGSDDGRLRVYSTADGVQLYSTICLETHVFNWGVLAYPPVLALALSADGQNVFTGHAGGTVLKW